MVNLCVDQPTLDNVYCAAIGRRQGTGKVNSFTVQPQNVSQYRTAGLDLNLDYLVLDCAESPDGRLLVFEADTGMVVQDMDSEDIYPYKAPQMRKVFSAFQQALATRIG